MDQKKPSKSAMQRKSVSFDTSGTPNEPSPLADHSQVFFTGVSKPAGKKTKQVALSKGY